MECKHHRGASPEQDDPVRETLQAENLRLKEVLERMAHWPDRLVTAEGCEALRAMARDALGLV